MELHQVLHMNGGEGETSYAKNSSHEKLILLNVKHDLQKCIREYCLSIDGSLSDCVKVADLGCSSGPNTLLAIQAIVQSIDKYCQEMNQEQPIIQVFLNDLFSNDFNTVFKSLPSFYEKLEKKNGRRHGSCLIAAMPGSFYDRLFPDRSMHFFHSSYSLHWLSQVPNGLFAEPGIPLNKGTIYIAKVNPRERVRQAYLDQFRRDFTIFLKLRAQEMVPGGQIFATFLSKNDESDGFAVFDLLDMALNDLVNEGYLEEEKLDTFNLPIYKPSAEELRNIIREEGSFTILHIRTFKLRHDDSFRPANDHNPAVRAAYVATFIRAVFEPIFASHFGQSIIPDLFTRFIKHTAKVLPLGEGIQNNVIVSLARK